MANEGEANDPSTATDAESGDDKSSTGGGSTAADIENSQNSNLGVAEVPPELKEKEKELLRAFHAKTQALAEEKRNLDGTLTGYKKDAEALYGLANQEWFKAAVAAEKNRRTGVRTSVSDEEFEVIKSDKKAFQDYLSNRDKALADNLKSEFKAEFEKLGKTQQELVTNREFEEVKQKYGEAFVTANRDKALDPYLDKSHDYETAFILYSQSQGKVAGATAPPKKNGVVVEKGGMSSARGGPVVKAKNLNEALDRAFDLSRRGIKDYHIERA